MRVKKTKERPTHATCAASTHTGAAWQEEDLVVLVLGSGVVRRGAVGDDDLLVLLGVGVGLRLRGVAQENLTLRPRELLCAHQMP